MDGIDTADGRNLKELWRAVVDEASKSNCLVPVDDQRIIVSSLAYMVFDLMSQKVKEKKIIKPTDTPVIHESVVSLYRYTGATLYSMIEKREKISLKHPQLKLLYTMKLKKNEQDHMHLPDALNQGGLVIVSLHMIPYVRELMHLVNKHVNSGKLQEHGKNMIRVALDKIMADQELVLLFKECLLKAGVPNEDLELDMQSLHPIVTEMSTKIFHSRVNEYMNSRNELDLAEKGKVTSADQSLRDILKTYCITKSRDTHI